MSRTRLRVNPHSIVASMSRNSLLEAGAKSEGEVTATGLEPSLAKWLSVRLRTKWFWVRVQLQSLHYFCLKFSECLSLSNDYVFADNFHFLLDCKIFKKI